MTWQQTIDEERFEAREEGREEGAHDTKIETARRMLADGLSEDLVTKYTALPIEEIRKL